MADFGSQKAMLTIFPMNDIPPYDGDLDGDRPPAAVVAFKRAIDDCDGLVICSPEYNFGMPGVLKNALDWASRPSSDSPLKQKPVLIMSASPGALGGARSHSQIRETLTATRSRVLPRPPVTITNIKEKVIDGRLIDRSTIAFILDALDDLFLEINLMRIGRDLVQNDADEAKQCGGISAAR
ncbi:NADPH-dependent FMN reductase (plasmid) [Ensifer adhaerens OV14]|nr:NADPH-dependent FMN reductase [Ensifer adhaerens OV14]